MAEEKSTCRKKSHKLFFSDFTLQLTPKLVFLLLIFSYLISQRSQKHFPMVETSEEE